MSKLAWFPFFTFFTFSRLTSGRVLDHGLPTPPPPQNTYQQITFFMSDVLGNGRNPSLEPESGVNNQLPLLKPRGLFPPAGGTGIPSREPNAHVPAVGESTTWLPYLSSLQALEFGAVTVIDEEFRGKSTTTSPSMGRARGIYVTIPEESSDHMMAMTAKFADGEDGLRLFGIHRAGSAESHVAVIGGTGRYRGANGYATVRRVGAPGGEGRTGPSKKSLLLVTVFLS